MEWVRFAFSALFLVIGLLTMAFATFGVYRYKFVLNRMHSAAMGDTLGLLSCLIGLMIAEGFTFTSLKLILVVICLWLASPVASHLISRLEVTTDPDAEKEFEKRSGKKQRSQK